MAWIFGSCGKFYCDAAWYHPNIILRGTESQRSKYNKNKGQNWDINGRFLDRTCFLQLSQAYMAGLDWQTLEKHIHRSTEPMILDLWLACEPCQMIIIKYPRNVAYSLRAGDNSASAVKHRPRKHSALLNGVWTPWYMYIYIVSSIVDV